MANVRTQPRRFGDLYVQANDEGTTTLYGPDISRLRQLADLHARVRAPTVPRLVFVDDADAPTRVVLERRAVCDMASIWQWADAADDETMTYGVGASIGQWVGDALYALHHQTGHALGEMSWANVQICDGLQPSVLLCSPPHPEASKRFAGPVQAPEKRLGMPATPPSDVYVIWALFQPLLGVIKLPQKMRAAILGTSPTDPPYLAIFQEVQRTAGSTSPSLRYPDIPTARASWRTLWDALGAGPDEREAQAFVAQYVAGPTSPKAIVRPHLTLTSMAKTVCLNDDRQIDLRRSPVSARLMWCLVQARLSQPGVPVRQEQLIEAGWPNECILPSAARNRAWVAMSRLRAKGLSDVLLADARGYWLDPMIDIRSTATD